MAALRQTFIISLLSMHLLSGGEIRVWTNAEGTKSFEAEFLSREEDGISLVRADGKKLTLEVAKLHENDLRWLDLNHPLNAAPVVEKIEEAKEEAKDEIPPADSVFDTLLFGDDRETVGAKLGASTVVSSGIDATFIGRTGLNGVYQTTQKIGGLHCYLSFDWDESGGLREITLQTEDETVDSYEKILNPCWEECIPLISSIHGKPVGAGPMPAAASLSDGQMLASHLWKIEKSGTVLLGTAKQGEGYQVVVRFAKAAEGNDPPP